MGDNNIVYSFWAEYPVGGYCESKYAPDNSGWIKEPVNATFCLISTIFGLLGIWMSHKNMNAAIIYLYALIVGYGITRALQHAFILNGLDKISGITLGNVQIMAVAGFAICIRNRWPINALPRWAFGMVYCVLGEWFQMQIIRSYLYSIQYIPYSRCNAHNIKRSYYYEK